MVNEIKESVPRLRFPEFRNDRKWKVAILGDICSFFRGKGISKNDISPKGKTPCIRYGELYTSYSEIIKSVISYTNISNDNLFFSKKNDILIPSSGETKEDIATASCLLLDNVALGGDLHILRMNHNGIFISYYINYGLKKSISKVAQGDTVVHLYNSQLKNIKLYLPSLPEQQKIADCLSSLDELIEAHEKKRDVLRQYKKGLMQRLFPAEGETTPRWRFPEFRNAGEWEKAPLGNLLLRSPDYGVNAPAVTYSSNLPTYIRITDISDNGKFIEKNKMSVDIDAQENNYLHVGDIVLARTGASVGKAYKYCESDGKLVFAGFLIRVSPNVNKLHSEYLFQFLFTEKYWQWVIFTSMRSGQPGINGTEYASLAIPLPSLPEQQKIADCLSALDERIATHEEKIAALREHKKGLMQQLFPSF